MSDPQTTIKAYSLGDAGGLDKLRETMSPRDLNTEPLKPCPFCGYEHPSMSVRENENGRFFDVTCGNCGVQHDLHESVAAVVEAWNMRTP